MLWKTRKWLFSPSFHASWLTTLLTLTELIFSLHFYVVHLSLFLIPPPQHMVLRITEEQSPSLALLPLPQPRETTASLTSLPRTVWAGSPQLWTRGGTTFPFWGKRYPDNAVTGSYFEVGHTQGKVISPAWAEAGEFFGGTSFLTIPKTQMRNHPTLKPSPDCCHCGKRAVTPSATSNHITTPSEQKTNAMASHRRNKPWGLKELNLLEGVSHTQQPESHLPARDYQQLSWLSPPLVMGGKSLK